MVLWINTKQQNICEVGLKTEGRSIKTLTGKNKYGSQALLPLIDKLLKSQTLKFSDLKGIEVETGPGSFTGLKVGVSVANSLGFALGIPVNGKKIEIGIRYS